MKDCMVGKRRIDYDAGIAGSVPKGYDAGTAGSVSRLGKKGIAGSQCRRVCPQ